MVESIGELRKICQDLEKDKRNGHIYAYYVAGRISIYITRLLLYTRITPNQVTFLNVLVKLAGAVIFIQRSVVGVILLQLGYILDRVDGEIARYRKTRSLRGRYWDIISSYITEPFVLLCLGIRTHYYALGILASFSLFLKGLAEAVKYELIYERVLRASDPDFVVRPVKSTEGNSAQPCGKRKLKQKICNAVFGSMGIVNIITLLAFAEYLFGVNLLRYPMVFYAVFLPYFWMKMIYNNTRQGVSQDYEKLLKAVKSLDKQPGLVDAE